MGCAEQGHPVGNCGHLDPADPDHEIPAVERERQSRAGPRCEVSHADGRDGRRRRDRRVQLSCLAVSPQAVAQVRAEFEAECIDPDVRDGARGIAHPFGVDISLPGKGSDVKAAGLNRRGERVQSGVKPLFVCEAGGSERRFEGSEDAQVVPGHLEPAVRPVDCPACLDIPAEQRPRRAGLGRRVLANCPEELSRVSYGAPLPGRCGPGLASRSLRLQPRAYPEPLSGECDGCSCLARLELADSFGESQLLDMPG